MLLRARQCNTFKVLAAPCRGRSLNPARRSIARACNYATCMAGCCAHHNACRRVLSVAMARCMAMCAGCNTLTSNIEYSISIPGKQDADAQHCAAQRHRGLVQEPLQDRLAVRYTTTPRAICNCAKHRNLRCVLHPGSGASGAWCNKAKHVSNRDNTQ